MVVSLLQGGRPREQQALVKLIAQGAGVQKDLWLNPSSYALSLALLQTVSGFRAVKAPSVDLEGLTHLNVVEEKQGGRGGLLLTHCFCFLELSQGWHLVPDCTAQEMHLLSHFWINKDILRVLQPGWALCSVTEKGNYLYLVLKRVVTHHHLQHPFQRHHLLNPPRFLPDLPSSRRKLHYEILSDCNCFGARVTVKLFF